MVGSRQVSCNLRASIVPPHRGHVLGYSRPELTPSPSDVVALSTTASVLVNDARLSDYSHETNMLKRRIPSDRPKSFNSRSSVSRRMRAGEEHANGFADFRTHSQGSLATVGVTGLPTPQTEILG
ncbi:unnamed protein product [Schistocephalus solidus]|uniref:Uncharacterized protein n=1 Tax=Schistocephalus solidus TaxID=70667 RepID=A0A183TCS6_SCHSO|nr:unnamed protein product [Schistocephalus solidus]